MRILQPSTFIIIFLVVEVGEGAAAQFGTPFHIRVAPLIEGVQPVLAALVEGVGGGSDGLALGLGWPREGEGFEAGGGGVSASAT